LAQIRKINFPNSAFNVIINCCWGACPKHRFFKDNTGEKGLNYLCPSYKELFEHIKWHDDNVFFIKSRKSTCRSNVYYDRRTWSMKSEFPDLDRNNPCTCESGLKFKNCHGKSR
jgi:hypothetical protein